MALKESKRGGNRLTTNVMGRPYFHFVEFVTNSTNAPDGQAPTASCTATRASTGVYSITFAEECKPAVVHHVDAYAVDTSTLALEYVVEDRGYVQSTGVLTIAVGAEDAGGVVAVADSTDVTIKVLTLCNGVSKVAE